MSQTSVTTSSFRSYKVPEKIIPEDVVSKSISHYTEAITYVRSKNITFSINNLKPLTRHYVYFEGTKVDRFITSKIIRITMISGSFQVGELVESDPLFTSARFSSRLCTPNHLYGPCTNPTKVFTSDIVRLPLVSEFGLDATSYTSSSNILNIDILGLSNESEVDFSGYILPGMKLIGRSSGAVAEVRETFLVSDETGFLTGSFFIPDPTEDGNPKFVNGSNTFIMSSGSNISDTNLVSFAQGEYYSSGVTNVTDENTITTRNYTIIPEKTVNETTVTTTVTKTSTVYVDTLLTTNPTELALYQRELNAVGGDYNQLSDQAKQAFLIESAAYSDLFQ